MPVGLTQRFLVLQLFVPSGIGRPLLLELGVSDTDRTRRRLLLSTAFREPVRNPLHAQVPQHHQQQPGAGLPPPSSSSPTSFS